MVRAIAENAFGYVEPGTVAPASQVGAVLYHRFDPTAGAPLPPFSATAGASAAFTGGVFARPTSTDGEGDGPPGNEGGEDGGGSTGGGDEEDPRKEPAAGALTKILNFLGGVFGGRGTGGSGGGGTGGGGGVVPGSEGGSEGGPEFEPTYGPFGPTEVPIPPTPDPKPGGGDDTPEEPVDLLDDEEDYETVEPRKTVNPFTEGLDPKGELVNPTVVDGISCFEEMGGPPDPAVCCKYCIAEANNMYVVKLVEDSNASWEMRCPAACVWRRNEAGKCAEFAKCKSTCSELVPYNNFDMPKKLDL